MKKALSFFSKYLLAGILFPLTIQYIIYYRYTPNYELKFLSKEEFIAKNYTGIFRYRVLGTRLHLWVYDKLASISLIKKAYAGHGQNYNSRLTAIDSNADQLFYFTYFLISTVFIILTCLCFLYLFDMSGFFELSDQLKLSFSVLIPLLISITQFVVTPYDAISYFFLALSLVLFLKALQFKNSIYPILLFVSIILATLTRESSLIIVCLICSVFIHSYGVYNTLWIRKIILPGLAFALPYCLLRYFFAGQSQISGQFTLFLNFELTNPKNLIAFSFFFFFLYVSLNIASGKENNKLIRTFMILTIPYTLMIFFVGLIIEIRLWIPLILSILVLAVINHQYLKSCLVDRPLKND